MGGRIRANSQGNIKNYTVSIAFAGFDSHGDKQDAFDTPEVYDVEIDAATNLQAIVQAMFIVTQARAEVMTDFMTDHPLTEGKETFTIPEIEQIRQESEKRGVFRSWLSIEPTSIQCHLTNDRNKLMDMTINNLETMTSGDNIANDVEEYLKGQDE
jgi:hypothetical protein